MTKIDDIMRDMLSLFPEAELGEDNDGQLVIYTGLTVDGEGNVIAIAYDDQDLPAEV